MDQSLDQRVATCMPSLAPAERRVALFFRDEAGRLGFLSAADIAARLGTSDATIVRTAQALGYRGLVDLKRALFEASTAAPTPTPSGRLRATLSHGADPRSVLEHALDVQEAAIAVARTQLPDRFAAAVTTLAGTDRIVLSGTGPSGPVAQYASLLLRRVGRCAVTITATGVSMADEVLSLQAGDALVLLAYTRLHADARVLLREARRRRVPVVVLTDVLDDLDGVDIVLTCPRGIPSQSSSHGLTLVVLEALAVALAAADRQRASRALRDLNRLRAQLLGEPAEVDP